MSSHKDRTHTSKKRETDAELVAALGSIKEKLERLVGDVNEKLDNLIEVANENSAASFTIKLFCQRNYLSDSQFYKLRRVRDDHQGTRQRPYADGTQCGASAMEDTPRCNALHGPAGD